MLIYYTTVEGGDWNHLEVEGDQALQVEKLRNCWDEECEMSAIFSTVYWQLIDVHAVLFPSSDVWDSHYGAIRQPGRPGYYEEVKELLHGKEEESQGREAVLDGN